MYIFVTSNVRHVFYIIAMIIKLIFVLCSSFFKYSLKHVIIFVFVF